MALAHLEFQEDYMNSPNSELNIALSNNVDDGTQARVSGDSAAIVPFHALNEEVDDYEPEMMPTISPERHMSTQDLFKTASPFAFSTVKKKPQRSSLRFAVITEEGDSFADQENGSPAIEIPAMSPGKDISTWSFKQTLAGNRPPLKDKNGRGGLRCTSGWTDRTSVSTCQDASPDSKHTAASCLDIDLDAGLECADRFLRSVGGIDLVQL
jgi:hypothetical protein